MKLLELIDQKGAVLAPAYRWICEVMPLISLPDEIDVKDDDYVKGIEYYRLIRPAAEKALADRDISTAVRHRKRLKEIS